MERFSFCCIMMVEGGRGTNPIGVSFTMMQEVRTQTQPSIKSGCRHIIWKMGLPIIMQHMMVYCRQKMILITHGIVEIPTETIIICQSKSVRAWAISIFSRAKKRKHYSQQRRNVSSTASNKTRTQFDCIKKCMQHHVRIDLSRFMVELLDVTGMIPKWSGWLRRMPWCSNGQIPVVLIRNPRQKYRGI